MEKVTANGYWSGIAPEFGYETSYLITTAFGAVLTSVSPPGTVPA